MTSEHGSGHEEALRSLALREPLPAEVARSVRECPVCRPRLDELLAAGHELDAWGESERQLVEEASAEADASDSELAARLVGELPSPRVHEPPNRRRAIAAAAAVLLATAIGVGVLLRPDDGPTWLGEAEGAAVSPAGIVDGYHRFLWKDVKQGDERYELSIYEEDGTVALLRKERLTTNELALAADEEEALPDSILWEVHLVDGDGFVLRRIGRAEARRGSP